MMVDRWYVSGPLGIGTTYAEGTGEQNPTWSQVGSAIRLDGRDTLNLLDGRLPPSPTNPDVGPALNWWSLNAASKAVRLGSIAARFTDATDGRSAGYLSLSARSATGAVEVLRLTDTSGVVVDPAYSNAGNGVRPGLVFGGHTSGEGIASKRSEGGSRYGLDFYTASTQRVHISNTGNVGIGSGGGVPSARLSVVGPGASELGGSITSTTLRTSAGSLGTAQWNSLTLASIGFRSGNHSSLGIRAMRVAAGSDWNSTAIGLVMDVDETARVNDSGVWLHANGSVGIGTQIPRGKLEVTGGALLGSVAVGGNAAGSNFPYPYETIGLPNPSHNLRLTSPNSILFHSGNSASAKAWIDPLGRIGLMGRNPTPIHPDWGGGIRTWDIEAEGATWTNVLGVGGSGSWFRRILFGRETVGQSRSIQVNFPVAFDSPPWVIAAARGDGNPNHNDNFAVSTRVVTNTYFIANITRTDSIGSGWGMTLQMDWIAWE
jgi:hypothetical protein